MFKIDLLEKIFLLVTIIDVMVLSMIAMFMVTLVVIGIFWGIILIGIGTFILLFETIKNFMTMKIFVGMGFLGIGILCFIVEVIFWRIFRKLIRTYPSIINGVKKFIILQDERQMKKKSQINKRVKSSKNRDNMIAVLLIVGIVLIVISIMTQNLNTVILFIENLLKWD